MRRIYATALALSCSAVFAGYKVDLDKLPIRTLPKEVYSQLVKNKSWRGLTWAWKDEDYDCTFGFTVQSLKFSSPKPVPEKTQEYFRGILNKLEDKASPYKLQLTIIDCDEITSFPKSGFITVEGSVSWNGKPMAAFVTCETVTSKGADGYKWDYAADDILKSFAGEILIPADGNWKPLAKPADVMVPRVQTGVDALDAKSAFRNRKLGMSIDAFPGGSKPAYKKGLVILQDPKEDLAVGRAQAKAIRYVFWKGKLVRVELEFPGGDANAAKVHQALKLVYGRGIWAQSEARPYLDGLTEVLAARGGVGRLPMAVNPIVWPGKKISMMLDGLPTGPRSRNTISPVLLTLDSVPLVEAMKAELQASDLQSGQTPNI